MSRRCFSAVASFSPNGLGLIAHKIKGRRVTLAGFPGGHFFLAGATTASCPGSPLSPFSPSLPSHLEGLLTLRTPFAQRALCALGSRRARGPWLTFQALEATCEHER